MHKFAQTFRQNPLDAIARKEYLARQIEPKRKNFAAQFKRRNNLTAAALEIEPKSSQVCRFCSDARD
jgi:hypothetical protein